MKNSSISKLTLEGREFLVKRDDLVDKYLSGNKYRKLYFLLQTPQSTYKKIISYGGTQSNAMLAIAAICKEKSWEFEYYSKPISKSLKEQEYGNLFNSISLGMKHIELDEEIYREYIASLRINLDPKTLVLDQGGADINARLGLEVLAKEIEEANLDTKHLATPSGTGTTALFLAQSLPEYKVYTTPSIGDVKYLREQMCAISTMPDNLIILEPKKKYHFAKLYREFYEMHTKLKNEGIEFDLLYAPGMWLSLLEQTNEKILYIHSGGVSGNETMLKRYEHKFRDIV